MRWDHYLPRDPLSNPFQLFKCFVLCSLFLSQQYVCSAFQVSTRSTVRMHIQIYFHFLFCILLFSAFLHCYAYCKDTHGSAERQIWRDILLTWYHLMVYFSLWTRSHLVLALRWPLKITRPATPLLFAFVKFKNARLMLTAMLGMDGPSRKQIVAHLSLINVNQFSICVVLIVTHVFEEVAIRSFIFANHWLNRSFGDSQKLAVEILALDRRLRHRNFILTLSGLGVGDSMMDSIDWLLWTSPKKDHGKSYQ